MIEQRINQSSYGKYTADNGASICRKVPERFCFLRILYHEWAQFVAEEYTWHSRFAGEQRYLLCMPCYGKLIREKGRAIRANIRRWNDFNIMIKHHGA